MKYRDIAKEYLLKFGSERSITSADASGLSSVEGERDSFTPKQLAKSQAALDDLSASLRKKWKIDAA